MTKADTLELSEWEAYCWLGYQKRLRFKSMLIIKSKTSKRRSSRERSYEGTAPKYEIQKESNTRVTFGGTKKSNYLVISSQQNKLNRTGGPSRQVHKKETKLWQMQVQLGFGLRTTMTVGNTPATSGQSEYKIKSGLGVGIFKNDPVSLSRCR